MVTIFENLDFSHNVWRSWYWSKFSKNLDFGQNFRESWFLSAYREIISILVKSFEHFRNNLHISQDFTKISILVKIFENLYFGQNFRKTPFCQNFRKFQFWSKLSKSLDFGQYLLKVWFWSFDLVNIFEHLDFGQNFQKYWFRLKKIPENLNSGRKLRKSRFLSKLWKSRYSLTF